MKLNFAKVIKHHLTMLISGLITFTLVFQVSFYNIAEAATISNSIVLGASASSMAKQVEGKAEQAMSNAEKSIGKAAAEVRGNNTNIKGKAKEGLGKVQSTADDAKYGMRKGMNKAESQAKQIGAKAEENSDNAIDAIKGFFGK